MSARPVNHAGIYIGLYLAVTVITICVGQDEVYLGRYVGTLNSYHHQVEGKIYAVDEYTLLFKDFTYDGSSKDAFFWAGTTIQPGPQGFIIPNKYGRTNVLTPYRNDQFTVSLPGKKKIKSIRWLSVYDLTDQVSFGDVFIPANFEPPAPQVLSSISQRGHGVQCDPVTILDSKTIKLPRFSYDGVGTDTFFYVGIGAQPSSKGTKVPDEQGYLNPLRTYYREDVILTLPGDLTVSSGVQWLSIYNIETRENFGHIYIPDGLNVPPSLLEVVEFPPSLPNCEPLHKDLQVSWDMFGPQITIALTAQIEDDEYIAFGTSGSHSRTTMIGGDAVIAYFDAHATFVDDYNITGKFPCAQTLGRHHGVCRDSEVGGMDNYQLVESTKENGIIAIKYRRPIISPDIGDPVFNREASFMIWAIGKLNHKKKPLFHRVWPRGNVKLDFFRESSNNCGSFIVSGGSKMATPSTSAQFYSHGNSAQYEYVYSLYNEALKLKALKKNKKPEELIKLDNWYHNVLPKKIKNRGKDAHLTYEELVQVMKWKLARGKFQPRLKDLVQMNTPRLVQMETKKAFRHLLKKNDLGTSVQAMCNLKGVGPAMASAVLACGSPETAAFMADECLMAIPEIEGIDYTTKEYLNMVNHIQKVVERLNSESENGKKWNLHQVDLALWTHYVITERNVTLLDDMPKSVTKENGQKKMEEEEVAAEHVENGEENGNGKHDAESEDQSQDAKPDLSQSMEVTETPHSEAEASPEMEEAVSDSAPHSASISPVQCENTNDSVISSEEMADSSTNQSEAKEHEDEAEPAVAAATTTKPEEVAVTVTTQPEPEVSSSSEPTQQEDVAKPTTEEEEPAAKKLKLDQ